MRIGIVGLGLIGGSLARGIKAQGRHQVFGYDTQEDVRLRARLVSAVDGELTPELLPTLDMVILAVYPPGNRRLAEGACRRIAQGDDCPGHLRRQALCLQPGGRTVPRTRASLSGRAPNGGHRTLRLRGIHG